MRKLWDLERWRLEGLGLALRMYGLGGPNDAFHDTSIWKHFVSRS